MFHAFQNFQGLSDVINGTVILFGVKVDVVKEAGLNELWIF